MGKVLGFRSGKTPWHKTPLPDVIAVYDRDPKRFRNARRDVYQVRRWDSKGNPVEIYVPTIRRAAVILCRWQWYKLKNFVSRGWQRLGGHDARNEK